MISTRELKEKLIELKDNIYQVMDYLNFPEIEKEIKELDKKIQDQYLWQEDPKTAEKIQTRLNLIKDQKQKWSNLQKETDELFLLIKDLESPESEKGEEISQEERELLVEVEKEYKKLHTSFRNFELEVYLGKKYDRRNAVILIYSGAGGVDAQDWAEMLLRMYQRYCDKKEFSTQLLDITKTEEGGIKNATLEVRGNYAYGLLKNEAGVHRLIRISPFSAQSLRHTSFALVEILPELEKLDVQNFKLNPNDLQVDAMKSSGPGGQNVNKRETAIRVTHLPTGLQVASQEARSQAQNREKAMSILTAKLINLLERKNLETIESLKEKISPEWGNQIRTYVLHPYKQVRDHRTKLELSSVEKVIDGDLDDLIEANLKKQN
jgi:peptide chain release factor 2